MVAEQIPNLFYANSNATGKDTVLFGDREIASAFTSVFRFKDKGKWWVAIFDVRVSSLGTPKLHSVHVTGNRVEHLKLTVPGDTYVISDEHRVDTESVERWQLKVIEQYRFQLLELALELALRQGETVSQVLPDGRLVRITDFAEPLTGKELKQLQKQIDTKIRQKITPDLLAHVAELYTRAGLQGEPPIQAVQAFYKCSHRTAQDYATKARRAGLLPKTDPGVVTVSKVKPKARKGKR